VTTRKFIEKEVFRSDNRGSAAAEEIIGRCYVMYVKDYYRNKPVGFDDDDVYVCESRYSTKLRSFKKLTKWKDHRNANLGDHVEIMARDEPLECKRVLSMFKDQEYGKAGNGAGAGPAGVSAAFSSLGVAHRDVEHSFPERIRPVSFSKGFRKKK
jgi:protein polybromo-1